MTDKNKIISILILLFLLAGVVWSYQRMMNDGILEKNAEIYPATTASSTQTLNGIPVILAKNFEVRVFQDNVPGARVIIFDPENVMLLSLTKEGKVAVLPDKNGDGRADETKVLIDKLRRPHGLALDCSEGACKLFVAEENQVAVYDYDNNGQKASGKKKIIDLPAGSGHNTRSLLIYEADGKKRLLISVGSSCNVCYESDWRRATILSANLDGSDLKMFAAGMRNSVFMAIAPDSGKIFSTEMGRDYLGDKLPPDEINVVEEGNNYGWPICYGKNVHDSEFDKRKYVQDPCKGRAPSFIDIPAHNAPLGLAFFGQGWPEEYRHDALIALHGSWNSSVPVGYKIVRARFGSNGEFLKLEDFLSAKNGTKMGRPVAVVIRSDRKIFFSDDSKGAVYILDYVPSK